MKTYLAFVGVVCLVASGWGSTYYVDSACGADGNNGTTSQTPWKTIAKVNAATLVAGDTVLFKRGGVWNESLAPAASGTTGSPISFDAYGAGPAPLLTGYLALPAASWTQVGSTNVWKATVTASSMNYVLSAPCGARNRLRSRACCTTATGTSRSTRCMCSLTRTRRGTTEMWRPCCSRLAR